MYALLLAQDPDEDAILELVLQRAGLAVTRASSLERAVRSPADRPPDLILTALGQPEPLAQVRALRAQMTAPLAIVVDWAEEKTMCQLLELGADLVCPRPVAPRLLVAQARALLRRATGNVSFVPPPRLTLRNFILDPAARTVQVGDLPPRRLTQLEFRLLYTLTIHRGQVLPAEIIVERVWGYGGEGEGSLLRGLVHRLRSKVEPDARRPRYITTIPGVGYTFQVDDKP